MLAHPIFSDIERTLKGRIEDVHGLELSHYAPRYTKTIENAEDGIFIVVPQAFSHMGSALHVLPEFEQWVPRRNVFSKRVRAKARAHTCGSRHAVVENGIVLRPGETRNVLYSPSDLHEALVSAYVAKALGVKCPFFPGIIQQASISRSADSQMQFYHLGHTTSLELMAAKRELEGADMRSEIALVALALLYAQSALRLKHMDLHSGNVLWRNAPRGMRAAIVPDFFGSGVHLSIPLREIGGVPAILDFGLSTVEVRWEAQGGARVAPTSLVRADYHLLESYRNPEWGRYDTELADDEGYDLATLLESTTRDLCDMRPLPLNCLRSIQAAQTALGNPEISTEGRPSSRVKLGMRAFLARMHADWQVSTYDAASCLVLPPVQSVTMQTPALPPSPRPDSSEQSGQSEQSESSAESGESSPESSESHDSDVEILQ